MFLFVFCSEVGGVDLRPLRAVRCRDDVVAVVVVVVEGTLRCHDAAPGAVQHTNSTQKRGRWQAGGQAGRQAVCSEETAAGTQKKRKKVCGKGALKALSEAGTRRNWTHCDFCNTRRNTAKRGGAQISRARTRNHSVHAQALVSLQRGRALHGGVDSFMKIPNLIDAHRH